MSNNTSIFLTHRDWQYDDWCEAIMEALEEASLELYTEPEEHEGSYGAIIHFAPQGSLGGFFVCVQGNTQAQLVLKEFSSWRDWSHVQSITSSLQSEGVLALCELDSGRSIVDRDFWQKQWPLEFQEKAKNTISRLRLSQERELSIPIGDWDISLSRENLPRDITSSSVEVFFERLTTKAALYYEAYNSRTMVSENGMRSSSWALIPTFIDKTVDFVSVVEFDSNEILDIQTHVLKSFLGDEIIEGDNFLLLPGISGDLRERLLPFIRKEATRNID